MSLYLVTFDIDNTQFLVNTETKTEAVQDAIIANQDYELLDEIDDYMMDEIRNRKNYFVEEIDMKLLAEMFNRNDCLGLSYLCDNVIVFNG